jgi:hypothetical protein
MSNDKKEGSTTEKDLENVSAGSVADKEAENIAGGVSDDHLEDIAGGIKHE